MNVGFTYIYLDDQTTQVSIITVQYNINILESSTSDKLYISAPAYTTSLNENKPFPTIKSSDIGSMTIDEIEDCWLCSINGKGQSQIAFEKIVKKQNSTMYGFDTENTQLSWDNIIYQSGSTDNVSFNITTTITGTYGLINDCGKIVARGSAIQREWKIDNPIEIPSDRTNYNITWTLKWVTDSIYQYGIYTSHLDRVGDILFYGLWCTGNAIIIGCVFFIKKKPKLGSYGKDK